MEHALLTAAWAELITDRCGDRVLRVPFDLLRSETLLQGTMADDAAITEIVDDIALSLFRLHCGTPASHAWSRRATTVGP